MTTYRNPGKEYPILTAHEALMKLLGDRSAYVDKWLEHVHADPEKHSIVQLPVPGKPLFSLYVLIDKAQKDNCTRDYLASCPTLLVQQSVAVADPIHRYLNIRGMRN